MFKIENTSSTQARVLFLTLKMLEEDIEMIPKQKLNFICYYSIDVLTVETI